MIFTKKTLVLCGIKIMKMEVCMNLKAKIVAQARTIENKPARHFLTFFATIQLW